MSRLPLLLALALAVTSCASLPATQVDTSVHPTSSSVSVRTEVPGGSVAVSAGSYGVRVILDQRGPR